MATDGLSPTHCPSGALHEWAREDDPYPCSDCGSLVWQWCATSECCGVCSGVEEYSPDGDCRLNPETQSTEPDWSLLSDSLSAEALAALQKHAAGISDDDEAPPPPTAEEVAAKQAVLEETMARLRVQSTETEGQMQHAAQIAAGEAELRASPPEEAVANMRQQGAVRLASVISEELCDRLLDAVNQQLADSLDNLDTNQLLPESGFGTVLVRNNRYDMYVKNEGVYQEALNESLQSGVLGGFFKELWKGQDLSMGAVRELSTLIADQGAPRQPLHPDVHYHPYPQLYTCFIALQDVEEDMGPTVFLTGTNTEEAHEQFNGPDKGKREFLQTCSYKSSLLKKGDCAIFEARLLHCGSANNSDKRRIMFYITFQDPNYLNVHEKCGLCEEDQQLSKFADLDLSLQDFC